MNMKAIIAKHAIITDQCRENRGDMEALNEAWDRIALEYEALTRHHKIGAGVKFHVTLDVELPPGTRESSI